MTDPTLPALLTVGGLGVVLLVITQLLKTWLPSPYVPHAAAGIGVLLAVGASVALGRLTAIDLASAGLTGFLAGASSSGFYAQQRPLGVLPPKDPEPEPVPRG